MKRSARVLLAPDSFKGSLDAADAARAMASGWLAVRPHDDVRFLPLADGGEGSLDVLATAVPGSRLVPVPGVTGPDGRAVDAAWLACPDGTAVVELARSSGLPLMSDLDPLGAHTLGLGEVLLAAARAPETRRLVVALGGSASTDGGTGALRALGVRFLGADGEELGLGGAALTRLAGVDTRGLVALPPVTSLVDVDAVLLGSRGAAAVFGPQKGARPSDVALLDGALARFVDVLDAHGAAGPGASGRIGPSASPSDIASSPGAGAAGGTAFGLAAVLGARTVPGAAHLADLAGIDDALEDADLVLTGEGSFDAQSLGGKVVGEVLDRTRRAGAAAAVVAGRVPVPLLVPGLPTVSLTELAGSSERALAEPARWASAAAARLAHAWDELAWGPPSAPVRTAHESP